MNDRLRIAVDFDGVLFDHVPYVLRGFRDAYGIDLAAEGLRHWDLFHYRGVQDAGLSHACLRRVLDALETDPVLHDAPPMDARACRIIARWRQDGHEVHVVTARHPRSKAVTAQFLDRNGIAPDQLVMGAAQKTGYDVLIDDAPHNVLMQAADGRLALLMDHSYNRDVPTHTNPLRVHDWVDVARRVHACASKAGPPRAAREPAPTAAATSPTPATPPPAARSALPTPPG